MHQVSIATAARAAADVANEYRAQINEKFFWSAKMINRLSNESAILYAADRLHTRRIRESDYYYA